MTAVAGTSSAGTDAGGTGTAGTGGSNASAGTAGSGVTGGAGGEGGSGTSGESGSAGESSETGEGGNGGAGGEGAAPASDEFGNGADGALSVDGDTDLATDNSGDRSCADGGDAVGYSIGALTSTGATLTQSPAAGCLAVGDEVLLINLQGTAGAHDNVGNYETLKVASVVDDAVTFASAKTRFYGDAADDTNIGTTREQQRVVLQRVPRYTNVTVAATGSLSAGAWDGVKGGVLFFRANGVVSVAGALSMSGKGYEGGAQNTLVNSTGFQGESIAGLGARGEASNLGGGGGGIGDGNDCESYGASAAGGGYAEQGADGSNACSGNPGESYGEATLLTKLLLGSGGGSGGTDNVLFDNPPGGFGGRGGGIVVVMARQLSVAGELLAAGGSGEGDLDPENCNGGSITDCWDFSGPGGGGSGGSVLLGVDQATLGTELVKAAGGLGGVGSAAGNGGDGSPGRIALHAQGTLEGTTLPAATVND